MLVILEARLEDNGYSIAWQFCDYILGKDVIYVTSIFLAFMFLNSLFQVN